MIYYANWKLNKITIDVKEYFKVFNKTKTDDKICFFTSPSLLQTAVNTSNFSIGSQNVCYENSGAFTGETSVNQILDLGAKSVLIGHSERRYKFDETDEIINKKLILCSKQLECVLCVGETQDELPIKESVLKQQLVGALNGAERKDYRNIIIAYEPVWAVGTGLTPQPNEIEADVSFIKKTLKQKYDFDFKVLYGGSVNKNNIKKFKIINQLDGFLVGGASLSASEFMSLIED